MLSVEAAVSELRRRCEVRWLDWVLGRGAWPMRIPLGAPKGAEFDLDVIGAQTWAGTWRSALAGTRLPGTLITVPRRALKLGTHDLPTTWVLAGPEDALAVAPDTAARYQLAARRLLYATTLPGVVWDDPLRIPTKIARTIVDLNDQDWANAVAVVTHLSTMGPGDALMVRQLAIAGVHSKWIERNAAIIGALLGVPADRTLGDPVLRLIHHLGLKAKETPLQVTLACPHLCAAAAGLVRFNATIPVLNASALRPRTVLIVENSELAHTLPTDLRGVAMICGLGKGIPLLAALDWTRTATKILYWGDIDRAGLAILANARREGIAAHAIMMDEATLDAYPDAQHETDTQVNNYGLPEGLNTVETMLYARLNAHHQGTGRDLQLEQEHIPIASAYAAIAEAIEVEN